MVRLPLGPLAALALAALASPAGGAELTQVATAAEPGNPFDLRLSIRWDRTQQRGKITREVANLDENPPFGAIVDATELRYKRIVNALVPRIALGLYEDLELHVDIPYVLADDRSWRYGFENGLPVAPISTIGGSNDPNVDAMNRDCGGPCPLFPVGAGTTIYHGGKVGDVRAGLAWGVFNDRKDDTKPAWVVGLDVTMPTAALYDPAAGRGATWLSPHADSAKPGSFGEKVWKFDAWTALSRRIGVFDPYFRAHVTAMRESNDTWSNCLAADALSSRTVPEMTIAGAQNCDDAGWEDAAGAKLPYVAGLLFGAEIIPHESAADEQKVAIDVRLWGDYTSRQRFYNELTDASGKLHWTEPYYTMGGLLALYLRASRYLSLNASASLATMTSHFLTGESLGRSGVDAGDVTGATPNAQLNPNFDWRYDAPGRRFRLAETSLFTISVAGVLQF
jgi:hypothetical protein